jgi:hypothetical protein
MCTENIAVYCKNRTKHVNTLCGQNVEVLTLQQTVLGQKLEVFW